MNEIGNLKIKFFDDEVNVSCTQDEARRIENITRQIASTNLMIGFFIGFVVCAGLYFFLRSLG